MKQLFLRICSILFLSLLTSSRAHQGPKAGPDKQGFGLFTGALFGAASGAVTGAQFSSATGPGAWIGAGFGAIWGSLHGLGLDFLEEEDLRLFEILAEREDDVWAQYAFLEHLELKKDLFPNRDIFPADNFFQGDGVTLSEEGRILSKYLAKNIFNKQSFSRIQVTSYIQTRDPLAPFTNHITKKRAQAIALEFAQNGIEPRRVVLQTVTLGSPLVDDKYDSFHRYSQAIEFSLLDL